MFAMNWLTTACSSKRMCWLSPITRSRRGPPRESRMGSIFGRDRIRFSCFRHASDQTWTVPWRGATGYFCNKGGLRKMAYPLGARSRFDAKPGIRRKNKNPAKPGKFSRPCLDKLRTGCTRLQSAFAATSFSPSVPIRSPRLRIADLAHRSICANPLPFSIDGRPGKS